MVLPEGSGVPDVGSLAALPGDEHDNPWRRKGAQWRF